MSYKVHPTETFSASFQRIAAEQIERAMACLQPDADVHKGAHEARKAMKRLRALLSLYRGALDESGYRDLNARFREIGRALAGTRDIQAMLDSIELLESSAGLKPGNARHKSGGHAVLANLKRGIEGRRGEVAADRSRHDDRLAILVVQLQEAGEAMRALELTNEGFDAIRPGLDRVYRQARRLRQVAYADDSGESFHEWRKALQRHWRHMQLLTPAWPREMRARAIATRDLAETVGQDHDLTMLELHLATHGRGLGSVAQVSACRQLCKQRQADLRASIEAEGELLFAEGATAFARRIERYWDIARARGEVPAASVKT